MNIDKFYKGRRWKKVRSRRLMLDGHYCMECKRYGKGTQARTVHHIFPIETHWELRLNIKNLVSLCNECHNAMHNRITDELTSKGIVWQNRIEKEIMNSPTQK